MVVGHHTRAFLAFLSLAVFQGQAADDWVLHVPDGHETASKVAQIHSLENLGEVIPGTNLFHFKQASSSHRNKRSLNELSESLSANPHVASHEPQQSLKRSKRIPVPQELARSTGNQLCFINTVSNEQKDSKRCIFPFSFRGKTYVDCTSDHSSNEAEWCATQVDAKGEVINKQWGDCDKKSLSCLTLGAGSLGKTSDAPAQPPPPQRRPQRPPPRPQGRFPPPQQGQFGPPPQGFRLPPGFNPQSFIPRGPPQGTQQSVRPPPRSFPQQPPRGNQPSAPVGKSAVPPQFQVDPSFLFGLANKLAGGAGGFNLPPGTEPGEQVPEEDFPEVDRSGYQTQLNDEAWPAMWYINREGEGLNMNVEDAWQQGYTGEGIVVSILDDGVERDHPDLVENYDPQASIDLNDNDKDPSPRYDFTNSNKHGTRCAGTVAATANNTDCAVGIAHKAKIGGVRILDGNILDVLEAKALSFNRDHIDIFSASWGPDDDGRTVDGPGQLAKLALKDGVERGRGGKGSIFVWASGNGGKYVDNCNCDGYTTSIFTLSVSSVSEEGLIPWYSEPCSSSLTTTYSSGSTKKGERKVVTTDLHGRCTSQHTGTSASSPMAAGIVALALEANPEMTWRDVQHIVVRTSRPAGHLKADDWASNAVGLEFSHSYGFGLMDAGALTTQAKDWELVPEQKTCVAKPEDFVQLSIKGATIQEVTIDVRNCQNVKHLEHIHLNIDLTSGASRGDLGVELVSPGNTTSVLLAPRPFDSIRTGFGAFKTWPMMSVHFWGEPVANEQEGGVWKLRIINGGDRPCVLNDWSLVFYGTETDPQPGVPIRPIFDQETEIFYDDDQGIEETTPGSNAEDSDTPENLEILNEREPAE